MPLFKTAALALKMLFLVWLLLGCGRKGPLFMQQEPVKPGSATTLPADKQPLDTIMPVQSQPAPTQTESQKKP